MSDTSIDKLTVEINATSTKANTAIDKLAGKLDKLTTALGKIDGSNLSGLANGVQKLGNATQLLSGMKATDYNRIAKGFERFAKIDYSGLSKTSGGLNTLARSLDALGSVQNLGNVTPAINAIKNLSRVDLSGFDTTKMASIANTVSDFANKLSSVSSIESSVTRVISSMARLSSSGQYINNVTTYFPQLGNQVVSLVGKLSTAGTIDIGATKVVDGIARLASAGKKVEVVVANFDKLGDGVVNLVTRLNSLPQINTNLANMIQGLGNIVSSGTKAGNVVGSLSNKLNTFSKSSGKASKKSFSLASAIGKLYATYWLLFRAFGKIKEAIDISSDLTEVQNVVDVTFGKYASLVEDMSETSITEFGMSELMVKEVSSRFQAMGTAMGFTQGKMADMSIELTKLTADMASFYNMEQEDVAQDLESIFTGQTRPLRTYGLDLTEATLKEWALKNGLDANIDSMTQAEKTMLRYQYVMENTGAAQGDFARTADTWANQVRILKQNFEQLGSVIGSTFINALKPLVKALNTVIGHVISFAQTVSDALGKIFGWQYEASGGGITSDLEDGSDAADDIADGIGDAADNAEKLKNELMGFDEISKLSDTTSSSSGSSSSGIGSSGTVSDGGSWVQTDSIFKAFESEIDSLSKLGKYISEALQKSMDSINWDSIYKKASGFGTGLATFLNGLFSADKNGNTVLGSLGTTLAGALNAVIYAVFSFSEEFNWADFGKALKDGIQKFINTVDLATAGYTVGNLVKGIATSVYTAVSDVNTWKSLGTKIADGINGFFNSMGKKDKKTGLTGWETLGKTISSTISGITKSMTTALETVEWEKVGQAIADFICAVEWGNLVWDFMELADAIGKAVIDSLFGFTWEINEETVLKWLGVDTEDSVYKDAVEEFKEEWDGFWDEWSPLAIIKKAFKTPINFEGLDNLKKFGQKIGLLFLAGMEEVFGETKIWKWIVGDTSYKEELVKFIASENKNKTKTSGGGSRSFTVTGKIEFDKKQTQTNANDTVTYVNKKGKTKTVTTKVTNNADEDAELIYTNTSSKLKKKDQVDLTLGNNSSKDANNIRENTANSLSKLPDLGISVRNTDSSGSNIRKSLSSYLKENSVTSTVTNTNSSGSNIRKSLSSYLKENPLNTKVNNVTKASTLWNRLAKDWGSPALGVGVQTTSASTVFKEFEKDWKSSKKQLIVNGKINFEAVGSLYGKDRFTITTNADGGLFKNGSWKPITAFAGGGLPGMGQMFVAREAGPELVGTIGGHTAIMNNDQIVSSVAAGVASAVAGVMSQFSGNSSQELHVYVGGREITDYVIKDVNQRTIATGACPIMT